MAGEIEVDNEIVAGRGRRALRPALVVVGVGIVVQLVLPLVGFARRRAARARGRRSGHGVRALEGGVRGSGCGDSPPMREWRSGPGGGGPASLRLVLAESGCRR